MAIKTLSLTLAACIAPLLAGTATAIHGNGNLNAFLKGSYRHSTSVTCAESADGFTQLPGQPDLQANGAGQMIQDYSTGVITYDGKGHATEATRGISLFPGPFSPFSFLGGTFEVNCSHTYAVNPDLSFTQEGSCTGTIPDGPAAGETVTVSGVKLVGQIGVGGLVLIINAIEPVEVALTLSGGFSTKRLCGSATTAVRLQRRHLKQTQDDRLDGN